MVITCAVLGCDSTRNRGVSFYRITTNNKLLNLWQKAVNINTSEKSKICSLHFKKEDFEVRAGKRRLKAIAVPSSGIINKTSSTEDDEDDDDNKNLSMLKTLLGNRKHGKHQDAVSRPAQDFVMVMPYCNSADHSNSAHINSKKTRDTGSQVNIKTDKEISLQSKIKMLNSRLKRRDAKISYMKTVFNMIKKHVKGTDMEYKLCCELENISETLDKSDVRQKKIVSEISEHNDARKKQVRVESPISDHNDGNEMDDDAESSSDEAGTFVEVTLSSNLRVSQSN